MWKRLTEQFASLGLEPGELPEEALTQIYQVCLSLPRKKVHAVRNVDIGEPSLGCVLQVLLQGGDGALRC